MKRQTITAVIPAYNEQRNIKDCINSVLWCDKVMILDMGSDRTGQIAKKLGAEVIAKFKTNRADFKLVQQAINWAIDNCKNDWMLRIDADERVTQELQKEIVEVLKTKSSNLKTQIHNSNLKTERVFSTISNYFQPKMLNTEYSILNTDIVAFGIPRRQFFLGGFLRGGDWAYDRLVRLFKPKYCRYNPIVAVHEQFKVKGKVGYLKNPLLHLSHPTLKELLYKFNIYTDAECKELDQSLLVTLFNLITQPPYIFARWMIYHHGYKDGVRGMFAGFMRSYYDILLYLKYIKYKIGL